MDDNERNEIGVALRASTVSYVSDGNETTGVITRAWDVASEIWHHERTANLILRSSEVLFSVKSDESTGGKYIHATGVGKDILKRLNTPASEISRNFPFHKFNPYADLFMRKAKERDLYKLPNILDILADADVVRWVASLNGFVSALRDEGKSKQFRSLMNEFRRLANKNYQGLLRYISALFALYSRLLIIRLDLGYLKKHCWPTDVGTGVTFEHLKEHWDALLKYLNETLPNGCFVGFAYKFEYGLEKGFHCHLMVFLDGSKVREDVTIARLIGNHWANSVTDGKGLYWNCNAFKNSYKSCGIGMVRHDDTEMREALEKAALYLTKIDYYIKMVAPGSGRTFGRGIMPKSKGNRGRPRRTRSARPVLVGDLPAGQEPAVNAS